MAKSLDLHLLDEANNNDGARWENAIAAYAALNPHLPRKHVEELAEAAAAAGAAPSYHEIENQAMGAPA